LLASSLTVFIINVDGSVSPVQFMSSGCLVEAKRKEVPVGGGAPAFQWYLRAFITVAWHLMFPFWHVGFLIAVTYGSRGN